MSCDAIKAALAPFLECAETGEGTCISTHCLYPSFDPVNVYVIKLGDGFRVHDGGGADRSSWLHGRDEQLSHKMLARYASRYHLTVKDGVLTANAPSASWLLSAILSVANASSLAANATIERVVASAELDLVERVFGVLSRRYGEGNVKRKVPVIGHSGKQYEFDFSVPRPNRSPILIDTVVPHHASIAHKYVAFADVAADGDQMPERWAVYDKPLEPDDASLMRQVAALVPFNTLNEAVAKEVARH